MVVKAAWWYAMSVFDASRMLNMTFGRSQDRRRSGQVALRYLMILGTTVVTLSDCPWFSRDQLATAPMPTERLIIGYCHDGPFVMPVQEVVSVTNGSSPC